MRFIASFTDGASLAALCFAHRSLVVLIELAHVWDMPNTVWLAGPKANSVRFQ
jgi:hypothetical protein